MPITNPMSGPSRVDQAPTAVRGFDTGLDGIDRFRKNGSALTTRLSAEDMVLESVRELIRRARALGGGVGDVADGQGSGAAAAVQMIRRQVVSLGNTSVGASYIFGGSRSAIPPFEADGRFVGDLETQRIAIGASVTVDISSSAPVLTATLLALGGLEEGLRSGQRARIEGGLSGLAVAADHAIAAQSMVAAQLRSTEETLGHVGHRAMGMLDRRQKLLDAESIRELADAQAALVRAYAAIGKVLQAGLLR